MVQAACDALQADAYHRINGRADLAGLRRDLAITLGSWLRREGIQVD